MGFGQRLATEDAKSDRGQLIAPANLVRQEFYTSTDGTRHVQCHYPVDGKPTQVLAMEYGPWNQATHEGSIAMLDRSADE